MSVTTITSRADAKNFRKMFREFLHSSFDITDDIIMDRLFRFDTIMYNEALSSGEPLDKFIVRLETLLPSRQH